MRGLLPPIQRAPAISTWAPQTAGFTSRRTREQPGIDWPSSTPPTATCSTASWSIPPIPQRFTWAHGKTASGGGFGSATTAARSGKKLASLKGQPIHALIQAPSDATNAFRRHTGRRLSHQRRRQHLGPISPEGSQEIHEIESLAVDPRNPGILYAGTWHLPWKTTDGGKTWSNIKKGVIVDSDIFSIIVDPDKPRIVYMSACSGIYKSEDSGVLFHKIQGIPNEARRTRVLMQDPENREIVYAGTTEGLYKTENGGTTFQRMTGPEVVVNDVYVDPRDSKHVLLATDRGGVLASTDGGENFTESNQGISERKVAALLVDTERCQAPLCGGSERQDLRRRL